MHTQSDDLKNPSHLLETRDENILLQIVQSDIKSILFGSQSSVKDFLSSNENSKSLTMLLAVSGGVDSQVMLHCLNTLKDKYGFNIFVVTVNHNIRPSEESKSDAMLVYNYCTEALNLDCKVITIEENVIATLNKTRKRGIEEAARYIRYTSIEKYAREINANVVLFAHNRDDQLETLIQHFLQGASAGISGYSSSGIRQFCTYPSLSSENNTNYDILLYRPLRNVSRANIESYAVQNNVPYRTDSTNTELEYLRNRIRHTLVPELNEHFTGWDTALLNGSDKAFQEALFIDELASKIIWEECDGVKTNLHDFYLAGYPVRVRAIYKALELIGVDGRFPYDIVRSIAQGHKKAESSSIELFHKGENLFIRKRDSSKILTKLENMEITSCGLYKTYNGEFDVQPIVQKNTFHADTEEGYYCIGPFSLPLVIRSKKNGETVLTAQGTHKSVKKIFSEWRVDARHKSAIPVIEYNGETMCLWGEIYGYSNWYVQHNTNDTQSVFIRFKRNNK